MPKPAHTRAVFEGVVGSVAAPLERWSFSVNFPADALPADGSDIVADGVAEDAFAAFNDHLGGEFPSDVHLTTVKVSHVNADGHVAVRADGSYVQGEWNGDSTHNWPPTAMPLQTALCISLVTAHAGPTGKGRFFLPWVRYSPATDTKRLATGDATTVANAVVAFLNQLATVLTFAPQVVSSKGYMSEVTGIRVGRAPDTMRSRREDLPEGYIVLPL